MSGKAGCPTAEDALADAVVRAVETLSEPGELTEASFGQFAGLAAGWHWELVIRRQITSEYPRVARSQVDTLEKRMKLVIRAWQRDVARCRQDLTPEGQ